MAILKMERKAGENKYLHREFHVFCDKGLRYVGEKYGDNGVKEYLRTFAARFYAPLVKDVKEKGLPALAAHLKKIYEIEEAPDALVFSPDAPVLSPDDCRLDVRIMYSPAVRYMQSVGYTPSRWYAEQCRTVFETIADLAGLGFAMPFYDERTGEAAYSFFRTDEDASAAEGYTSAAEGYTGGAK